MNRTLTNRTKSAKLAKERRIPYHHIGSPDVVPFLISLDRLSASTQEILFSIGVQLLGGRKDGAIPEFLDSHDLKIIRVGNVPREFDILGSAYQYLSTKAENLERGAFYTSPRIAHDIVKDLKFDEGQTIFDPSCGSGVFLYASEAAPHQIFGVDNDPIAVMVAKFNYFIKFKDAPAPNLYCEDYFEWTRQHDDERFDYVVGNPPFGANLSESRSTDGIIRSGESFSKFLVSAFSHVSRSGLLRFILPEAALNVPRHEDLRDFLLSNFLLERVTAVSGRFSGVMTGVVVAELSHKKNCGVYFEWEGGTNLVPVEFLRKRRGQILSNWHATDRGLLELVEARADLSLAKSHFGLGIVTGDNRTKLLSAPAPGLEPVLTGKQVHRYFVGAPKTYVRFDRNQLQQVAPDYIYRTPNKLVYRAIGRRPVVAVEPHGMLTTNSANIILPQVDGYSPLMVASFLNSDLYAYLYSKMFGGVNKIAKKNLLDLKFPKLTPYEGGVIERLGAGVVSGRSDRPLQEFIARDVFGLSGPQMLHVEQFLKDHRMSVK